MSRGMHLQTYGCQFSLCKQVMFYLNLRPIFIIYCIICSCRIDTRYVVQSQTSNYEKVEEIVKAKKHKHINGKTNEHFGKPVVTSHKHHGKRYYTQIPVLKFESKQTTTFSYEGLVLQDEANIEKENQNFNEHNVLNHEHTQRDETCIGNEIGILFKNSFENVPVTIFSMNTKESKKSTKRTTICNSLSKTTVSRPSKKPTVTLKKQSTSPHTTLNPHCDSESPINIVIHVKCDNIHDDLKSNSLPATPGSTSENFELHWDKQQNSFKTNEINNDSSDMMTPVASIYSFSKGTTPLMRGTLPKEVNGKPTDLCEQCDKNVLPQPLQPRDITVICTRPTAKPSTVGMPVFLCQLPSGKCKPKTNKPRGNFLMNLTLPMFFKTLNIKQKMNYTTYGPTVTYDLSYSSKPNALVDRNELEGLTKQVQGKLQIPSRNREYIEFDSLPTEENVQVTTTTAHNDDTYDDTYKENTLPVQIDHPSSSETRQTSFESPNLAVEEVVTTNFFRQPTNIFGSSLATLELTHAPVSPSEFSENYSCLKTETTILSPPSTEFKDGGTVENEESTEITLLQFLEVSSYSILTFSEYKTDSEGKSSLSTFLIQTAENGHGSHETETMEKTITMNKISSNYYQSSVSTDRPIDLSQKSYFEENIEEVINNKDGSYLFYYKNKWYLTNKFHIWSLDEDMTQDMNKTFMEISRQISDMKTIMDSKELLRDILKSNTTAYIDSELIPFEEFTQTILKTSGYGEKISLKWMGLNLTQTDLIAMLRFSNFDSFLSSADGSNNWGTIRWENVYHVITSSKKIVSKDICEYKIDDDESVVVFKNGTSVWKGKTLDLTELNSDLQNLNRNYLHVSNDIMKRSYTTNLESISSFLKDVLHQKADLHLQYTTYTWKNTDFTWDEILAFTRIFVWSMIDINILGKEPNKENSLLKILYQLRNSEKQYFMDRTVYKIESGSEIKLLTVFTNGTTVYNGEKLTLSSVVNKINQLTEAVTSNTDVVTSNTDVVTSNTDVVTSNPDVVTSNTDVVTSNTDVVTSNPDVVTSNTDAVTSNTDVVTSNMDVVTSNPESGRSDQGTQSSSLQFWSSGPNVSSSNQEVRHIFSLGGGHFQFYFGGKWFITDEKHIWQFEDETSVKMNASFFNVPEETSHTESVRKFLATNITALKISNEYALPYELFAQSVLKTAKSSDIVFRWDGNYLNYGDVVAMLRLSDFSESKAENQWGKTNWKALYERVKKAPKTADSVKVTYEMVDFDGTVYFLVVFLNGTSVWRNEKQERTELLSAIEHLNSKREFSDSMVISPYTSTEDTFELFIQVALQSKVQTNVTYSYYIWNNYRFTWEELVAIGRLIVQYFGPDKQEQFSFDRVVVPILNSQREIFPHRLVFKVDLQGNYKLLTIYENGTTVFDDTVLDQLEIIKQLALALVPHEAVRSSESTTETSYLTTTERGTKPQHTTTHQTTTAEITSYTSTSNIEKPGHFIMELQQIYSAPLKHTYDWNKIENDPSLTVYYPIYLGGGKVQFYMNNTWYITDGLHCWPFFRPGHITITVKLFDNMIKQMNQTFSDDPKLLPAAIQNLIDKEFVKDPEPLLMPIPILAQHYLFFQKNLGEKFSYGPYEHLKFVSPAQLVAIIRCSTFNYFKTEETEFIWSNGKVINWEWLFRLVLWVPENKTNTVITFDFSAVNPEELKSINIFQNTPPIFVYSNGSSDWGNQHMSLDETLTKLQNANKECDFSVVTVNDRFEIKNSKGLVNYFKNVLRLRFDQNKIYKEYKVYRHTLTWFQMVAVIRSQDLMNPPKVTNSEDWNTILEGIDSGALNQFLDRLEFSFKLPNLNANVTVFMNETTVIDGVMKGTLEFYEKGVF